MLLFVGIRGGEWCFWPIFHKINTYILPFPQMKMLDMGFWQIGFDKSYL